MTRVEEKIQIFIQKHPEYKDVSQEKIVSVMLQKGELTRMEAMSLTPEQKVTVFGFSDDKPMFEWFTRTTPKPISEEHQVAIGYLKDITQDAQKSFTERENEAGVLSETVNVWKEIFDKQYAKSTVRQEIESSKRDVKELELAASGQKSYTDFMGQIHEVTFEETFKKQRGVEYNKENIEDCHEKSRAFAAVKTSVDMINQTKSELGLSTRGDVESQMNPQTASAKIIKAFKLAGVTSLGEINKTLKDIEEKYKNHPDVQKYGGDFRFGKNKQGQYVIYRTAKNGYPAEATNEELKIVAQEMGMRLDKALATALGVEYNENATAEEMAQLTQKTYDKYQKDYEDSFAKAYGKKDVKALTESYIQKQQQGVANIETGLNIASMALMVLPSGAVAASGWLLKGSLALKAAKGISYVDKAKKVVTAAQTLQKVSQAASPFIMANMTLRPTELLEQLTSKNGMSAEEWKAWGKGVLQNSVYMAAGMGASKLAEIGASMYKTKALVTTLKQAGKSTDEIAAMIKANPVKFPSDIVKSLNKVDNLAKTLQITSEAALDISGTVLVNKALNNGELLPMDVINSIAFAISGGVLQKQFAPLSTEAKVSFLENALKDYGINKEEAKRILDTMDGISAGKIRVKKTTDVSQETNTPKLDETKQDVKPDASKIEAPKMEFKKLTGLEFIKLKQKVEQNPIYKENYNDIVLSKENVQLADMILSDEKLFGNENIMKNIKTIISASDTLEKAEIAKTILSNEKLYNNKEVIKHIYLIISETETPERAQAKKDIIELYCSNEKLYNNENVTENIGDIIFNTKTLEQVQAKKDITELYCSNEKLYNNENVTENIGDIIFTTKTPEQVQARKEIIDIYCSNEKLYNNKNVTENIGGIILSANSSERVQARKEIIDIYCSNEKLYNNKNVTENIGGIIMSVKSPEKVQAKKELTDIYCSDEKLYNNEAFAKNIGNIIRKVKSEDLPLVKQIFQTEGLNPEKTLEILESVKLKDWINMGETDTQRVKLYISLLQDKKLSPFVVEQLNNGMDMNTAAFLAKTQKKINAEYTPQQSKPQLAEELQNSYDIFTSHGMKDKEAAAVVKAISQDGIPDIALQSVALDLMQKGIPANKIGDVIKNAKITGEFNPKIVDDFVSLQNSGLNPLLEKNLAVLNNISGADTAVKFNSNVKKQIKGMLERLTPEQNKALSERGFDIEEINKKLDTKIVRTSDNIPQKAKVVSGLRTKQSITGFEKVVTDKYNPDQKIWQDEQKSRAWAEDKYNSIINRDYKSTTYKDANEPREKGLKEWADFMATEPELKDNPFAKVILADFVTKDLLPENADIPPQLDKNLVKEILSSADKNTNFSKLYSDRIREKAMKNTLSEQVEVNGVKGIWYTVPQTDKSSADYRANVDKVKAFSDGTNWCIRTYNAEPYVEQGAMHFFVDENGLTQVCIRENRPGSVYEIQKRQQNATVPIAHIDIIDDYMKRNGLTPQRDCQSKIETARRAKPEFDRMKAEFTELIKKQDYKSVLEKIGITVKENPDGTLVLSHYDPEINGFTLSDLGIKENDLLMNVVKIEGDAKFKNSNATALPRLQEVGGKLEFEDSNISDVHALRTINGKEIKWQAQEAPLNMPVKSMIYKSGDKFYLKPEFEKQIRDIANQIRKTALDKENDIVKLMKRSGFEVNESKIFHRAKGAQSLYDKLKNYLIDKGNADNTLNNAIKSVKDAVGTRTVLENKDYTKHPEVAALLNAGKRREAVLRAAELQSQEMFENLKAFLIEQKQNNTEFSAIRVNNYMANDGIPYFSESQLAELQVLGVVGIKTRILPDDENAKLIDFDNDTTTKIRESGYTAYQMNFKTKDGFVFEWQFRGEEVNRFAEGEHIPYDLRTDKDISSGNKDLELLYKPIKDLLNKDTMEEDVFKAYNKYLSAHYNYLREKELGFEAKKPVLEDYGNFDKRLRAENLEILHDVASQLKDGEISADEAVKLYQKYLDADKISSDKNAKTDAANHLSRDELKQKLKEGIKLEQNDIKETTIPVGHLTAPSAKFAATKEAYIDMLCDYAYDFAYLNAYIKDKTILAKAINQIGNEGMDFTGIEHPFSVNNSIRDRGLTAFDGSSEVEINTKRFGLHDEFNNDVAELSHRIFHEKRHVYQNIQRSLRFGEAAEPLTLYANDLAEGSQHTASDYYNYVKNNKYDYNAALDGRFPDNVNEVDVDYGMQVSYNQANYIENGADYRTQFVEKDAEDIGQLCGQAVDDIIKSVEPDVSKISPIAKAAKYAQDNHIDFDEAYKIITKK